MTSVVQKRKLRLFKGEMSFRSLSVREMYYDGFEIFYEGLKSSMMFNGMNPKVSKWVKLCQTFGVIRASERCQVNRGPMSDSPRWEGRGSRMCWKVGSVSTGKEVTMVQRRYGVGCETTVPPPRPGQVTLSPLALLSGVLLPHLTNGAPDAHSSGGCEMVSVKNVCRVRYIAGAQCVFLPPCPGAEISPTLTKMKWENTAALLALSLGIHSAPRGPAGTESEGGWPEKVWAFHKKTLPFWSHCAMLET